MTGTKSGSGPPMGIEGLPEWLLREGAMWRPLEQKGNLIKPARTPRSTAQLFAACERALVDHLKMVCTWPQAQRNQSWRVGDYSFYVLSFPVSPKVERFAQFWSEPQEPAVLFEVSAGTVPKAPKSMQLSEAQQEVLRDRGFEVGGAAGNFGKSVTLGQSRAVKALARETIAVLCEGLGYDGTVPLTFSLNLETRARVGHVYESLAAEGLLALLAEWGWAGKLDTTHGGTPFVQTQIGPVPLGLYCLDPSDQAPDEYRCVVLRTYLDVSKGDAGKVAQELNQRLIGARAFVDEDGDLVLESEIFLQGGVTAEHAKQRIEWFTAVLQGA